MLLAEKVPVLEHGSGCARGRQRLRLMRKERVIVIKLELHIEKGTNLYALDY